jgi:hypothetical protein
MVVSGVLGVSVARRTRWPRLVIEFTRFGALVGLIPSFFVGLYVGAPMGAEAIGPAWSVLGASIGWAGSLLCGMILAAIALGILSLPITLAKRSENAA